MFDDLDAGGGRYGRADQGISISLDVHDYLTLLLWLSSDALRTEVRQTIEKKPPHIAAGG